jgi:hypothetical protein
MIEFHAAAAAADHCAAASALKIRSGIVNLGARGTLVVAVARRLGSEGPLLAYCAAPL